MSDWKSPTPAQRLIRRFLCPGCVCGSDPATCGAYKPAEPVPGGHCCAGHVIGTYLSPAPGHVVLGLPKGFCRPGRDERQQRTLNWLNVRLWPSQAGRPVYPEWDRFNVAVWALRGDDTGDADYAGYLFVRTFLPRRGEHLVDVLEGGRLERAPGAVNVGEFYADID